VLAVGDPGLLPEAVARLDVHAPWRPCRDPVRRVRLRMISTIRAS
jgi:hypothetical protein